MKTKGITRSSQIDAINKSKISQEAREELSLKSMLISCFAYGGIKKDSYNYETYILPYKSKLNESIFNEVYQEMESHFANCEVKESVYTDCEGLTYNSITE